jgi:ATP adenylyltransferase
VSLDRLWAGWRAAYVGGTETPEAAANGAPPSPLHLDAFDASGASDPAIPGEAPAATGCVFCAIERSDTPDAERFVVWSGNGMIAVLNAYPYTSGHVLVMPRRHVAELEELSPDEAARLWEAVEAAVRAVKAAYHPDGLNLGLNLGRAAGAGIPAHLHVHVVPRWVGDTNFMTATAEVRVLPEALSASWQRLRAAWAS